MYIVEKWAFARRNSDRIMPVYLKTYDLKGPLNLSKIAHITEMKDR